MSSVCYYREYASPITLFDKSLGGWSKCSIWSAALRACLKRSSARLSGGTAQSAALLLLEIALLVHRRRTLHLGPSRSEILGRTLLNTLLEKDREYGRHPVDKRYAFPAF